MMFFHLLLSIVLVVFFNGIHTGVCFVTGQRALTQASFLINLESIRTILVLTGVLCRKKGTDVAVEGGIPLPPKYTILDRSVDGGTSTGICV
jgi:hypothetical protein